MNREAQSAFIQEFSGVALVNVGDVGDVGDDGDDGDVGTENLVDR